MHPEILSNIHVYTGTAEARDISTTYIQATRLAQRNMAHTVAVYLLAQRLRLIEISPAWCDRIFIPGTPIRISEFIDPSLHPIFTHCPHTTFNQHYPPFKQSLQSL